MILLAVCCMYVILLAIGCMYVMLFAVGCMYMMLFPTGCTKVNMMLLYIALYVSGIAFLLLCVYDY